MSTLGTIVHRLHEEEIALLRKLRAGRGERLKPDCKDPSFADRVSDSVAAMVGSWPFIIVQSILLILWMALNLTGWVEHWDPYPFILLNLALSFQAAYAAPFIMMSQNRQAAIDRDDARHDYEVNIKAELEIELLHQKLDLMRETEMLELIRIIRALEERIAVLTAGGPDGEV